MEMFYYNYKNNDMKNFIILYLDTSNIYCFQNKDFEF